MKRILSVGFLLFFSTFSAAEEKITIDTDFPGGNIVVDSLTVEGNSGTVRVRPDLRDSADWFYYAFRVKHAEGKTLQFVFNAPNKVGSRGPAISTDEGQTWRHLSDKPGFDSQKFTYTFGETESSVLFALAPLYTQKEWEKFLEKYSNDPRLRLSTLCQSRQGRAVELLQIPNNSEDTTFGIALTVRHHCCEMTASWVLEGILAEALSDSPSGKWLQENASFFVVPFVDKDGVEKGDQGKNRRPHDHNRDYNHEIYPEIKALKAQISSTFADKKIFFLDLHCPWIRHGMNEYLYFPGPENPQMAAALKTYCQIFEKCQKNAKIPYLEANNLPFGESWNNVANYRKMENGILTAGSKMWAATLPGVVFAGTIEVPYSNSSGVETTPEACRELGRNMTRAMVLFLQNTEKGGTP
ncbi:MAG: M14-type cytosolic carboxypeptidase [Planctomycetia bacterium]|nr:M14-type cytosolic carboxypeptidase [Planctomycetia bacterium]